MSTIIINKRATKSDIDLLENANFNSWAENYKAAIYDALKNRTNLTLKQQLFMVQHSHYKNLTITYKY